ncbi:MAG: glucosylceramidase, partial [Bacteroidaceae bacterium]|nr:glucosylceramidase [Bacteroidaceae bacterium]
MKKMILIGVCLAHSALSPTAWSQDVKMLSTTSDRQLDLAETHLTFSAVNGTGNTIRLLPEETFQTMDGFGVAITGSTCYNLMRMTEESRTRFLEETFSPETGYGFSYCRISIGASDFSLDEYTCCDTPGIEHFALTDEENHLVIPILQQILRINPALKIMGTPWTPPRWMKVKDLQSREPFDSWTSGSLNPDCYADYATYFVKWIQAFQQSGIPIYSVTPQNEPLNRGNSVSCYMPWEEQAEFVKVLGPALKKARLSTKIFAFDHNYNYDNITSQQGYVGKIYADEEAGQYLSGGAFHNYGGSKDELIAVHNATPGKDLVFTETSIGTWNDGRNLERHLNEDMEELGTGTINRWCKGVIVWNLMLDEERGPNRPGGCQTCYGAVDINMDYTKITKNSHYYIIAHLSSVIKPDAVRIGTSGYTQEGLTYSAFKNPDGSFAVVMNNANPTSVKLAFNDGKP